MAYRNFSVAFDTNNYNQAFLSFLLFLRCNLKELERERKRGKVRMEEIKISCTIGEFLRCNLPSTVYLRASIHRDICVFPQKLEFSIAVTTSRITAATAIASKTVETSSGLRRGSCVTQKRTSNQPAYVRVHRTQRYVSLAVSIQMRSISATTYQERRNSIFIRNQPPKDSQFSRASRGKQKAVYNTCKLLLSTFDILIANTV